jgi:hypothetical protein
MEVSWPSPAGSFPSDNSIFDRNRTLGNVCGTSGHKGESIPAGALSQNAATLGQDQRLLPH